MRRKRLKGIAEGLAGKFISRYNDIGGYWGIGVIYLELSKMNLYSLTIDLKNNNITPSSLSHLVDLDIYKKFIDTQLENNDFKNKNVSKITIEIKFNVTASEEHLKIYHCGGSDPTECIVNITDDLNKTHTSIKRLWCWKHKPNWESKRAIVYEK